MSTILLPALRSRRANLYHYALAGVVSSSSQSATYGGSTLGRVILSEVGLAPGDVISASAECRVLDQQDHARLIVLFEDADRSTVDSYAGPFDSPTDFAYQKVEGVTIPDGTVTVRLSYTRGGGSVDGTAIRKGMINRGPAAMPYDIPKRGAYAPMTHAFLERENRQSIINYYAGASQLTSLPSRQWQLSFETPILEGDELREWSMALHELSDQGNVFRFTPPEYQGPSTGYRGANPVVSGASQLGTTLTCSGVDPETEILGPGDFLSFDVTTPRGNTNVELNRVRSLAVSDEEGNVTFELARPIRLAPADGATVQIFAPTGQFRLRNPRGGIDLGQMRRATVSIDAIEAIFL